MCQQSTGTHNASISAAVVGACDHNDGASDDHEPRQHDEADADGVLTSCRVLSVVEVGDAARQQQEDRDAPTRRLERHYHPGRPLLGHVVLALRRSDV